LNALRVMKARHLRHDENGDVAETPGELFTRVSTAIADVDREYGLSDKEIEANRKDFYDLMASGKFIPGGSYLRNAGIGGPMSNCHVLPISDSIEEIYESIKQTAMLTQSAGGGVGFNFSHIRPEGDFIASSGGLSTGPISFMRVIDTSNIVIGMGGFKKAASMAVLNIDHPDILEFINAKKGGRDLTTFNVSVGVTDTFMKAVKKNEEYDLINPRTNTSVGQLNARAVFDLICTLAHDNGDPGMLFLDNTNKYNPLPGLGPLESTNICGEQWLHPYDVCNLGSLNLAKFVTEGKVDFEEIKRITKIATRFMDNGVDLGEYSVPEVQEMAKANRRIGLGVMGWADMLIQLGIKYDSDEGIQTAREVMKCINDTARETSIELAEEKGVFPNYDLSIYKEEGIKIRNCARTTVAPTGSISMVADCSSGIEPIFALVFRKNVADARGVFYVNNYFEKIAKEHGFYSDEVMGKVSEHGSVQGIDEIPEDIQTIFATAHEITPEWHVKMQAAFQEHVDNSISKTINMPNSATVEDVKNVYMQAWESGCKGITIFRDGSRDMQVLTTGNKESGNDTQVIQSKVAIKPLNKRTFALEEKL
ncbi:adenosylcobalamin-dependent ribonucleoside-diphosphate reductase, partial [candidate division WWE3 bacterium]|nr:adenosylcobalamin-dependent ribonucleoside-diphosphate reductase [candidate division WWE3 bacterium]